MTAPLDLDAIRQWYESTRLSAGPWHPIAQQVPALLAEVERLRDDAAEHSSWLNDLADQKRIEALRADTVPRSALVVEREDGDE